MIEEINQDAVYGELHLPAAPANSAGIVLTHGAGSNYRSPLLMNAAVQLAERGFHVLRCDLAFRRRRGKGPPIPGMAGEDRESLAQAAAFLRKYTPGRLILGGHSYGGRQATILVSERQGAPDHLLLLSYPLHPPGKPAQQRTAHFPEIKISCSFVHGTNDPFGTRDEMEAALKLIPARTSLAILESAGHDLRKGVFDLPALLSTDKTFWKF